MDHNMGGGDHHDSGLALSLGRGGPPTTTTHNRHHHQHHRSREVPFEPSLTLSISDEAASSFSTGCPSSTNINNNKNNIVKRERDVYLAMSEEGEVERANSSTRTSDDDEDGSNARKKLRLTKEQSALLEDRFKEHSTLNPKQKQTLAKQLNLRPRQVEVWFQNRRARTKLKQTEVDCEFLKRCCETLTDENRRLHKELSELRALKFAPPPLYMQLPAATLTMCPSCERVGGSVSDGSTKGGSTTSGHGSAFVVAAAANKQPAHFFNPFTHSAAC